MKHILVLFTLIASLIAGGAEAVNVYCTTYPLYLFTKNLTAGAKNVHTELIIPPGTGCPHDYALTPRDMRKLGVRNLILIRNGAGLDDFLLKPLQKMNPSAKIIDTSKGIKLLAEEDHCEHGCGHHHHSENPHLFASPFEAVKLVSNIAAGLEKEDPANAAVYRKNKAAYTARLQTLCNEFRQAAEQHKFRGKKIVTQHGVFDYLAREIGWDIAGSISGGAEAAVTATDMMNLVRKIKPMKVHAIFTEPQYPAKTAQTIAKECGIPVVELDPVANGPAAGGADYYEKTMRKNLDTLKRIFPK